MVVPQVGMNAYHTPPSLVMFSCLVDVVANQMLPCCFCCVYWVCVVCCVSRFKWSFVEGLGPGWFLWMGWCSLLAAWRLWKHRKGIGPWYAHSIPFSSEENSIFQQQQQQQRKQQQQQQQWRYCLHRQRGLHCWCLSHYITIRGSEGRVNHRVSFHSQSCVFYCVCLL